MTRPYQIISGDSHLDIPPERWVPHVPPQYRDRAPRTVRLPDGNDAQILENRPPLVPTLTLTGVPYQEIDLHPRQYTTAPGTGPPEQRLREQDQDGVDAEILFTHVMYPSFWRGLREDEVYRAIIHAYNEWLAEEYCPYAPDRLIPMGVIPDTRLEDALAELEYCARAGFKGVCLYKFPGGKGYPTPEDDRFWAKSLELGMPLTLHTNGGTTRFTREGPSLQHPRIPKEGAGRDPLVIVTRFASDAPWVPLQMAFAGVFDRFPDLQLFCAETQIGWLAHSLPQIDDNWERHRYWADRTWGMKSPQRRLSEYLRDNCLWNFITDPYLLPASQAVGVQRVVWGSDFAHAQGDWPNSRKVIDETFAGVSADERHLMLAGNAISFFHLGG